MLAKNSVLLFLLSIYPFDDRIFFHQTLLTGETDRLSAEGINLLLASISRKEERREWKVGQKKR
jgi:hypothetical protein